MHTSARASTLSTRLTVRASGARVGWEIWTSGDAVLARANKFDSDLSAFDSVVDSNPMFMRVPGSKTGDLGMDLLPNSDPKKVKLQNFYNAHSGLEHDWRGDGIEHKNTPGYFEGAYSKIKNAYVRTSGDMDIIATFEARLAHLSKEYQNLGYIAPMAPAPNPDGGSGGSSAKNPVESFFGSISTIVWIVGIGIVSYFGLVYVAPSLLGAAAKTKAAGRALKEA